MVEDQRARLCEDLAGLVADVNSAFPPDLRDLKIDQPLADRLGGLIARAQELTTQGLPRRANVSSIASLLAAVGQVRRALGCPEDESQLVQPGLFDD